jgi:hypothetical protein
MMTTRETEIDRLIGKLSGAGSRPVADKDVQAIRLLTYRIRGEQSPKVTAKYNILLESAAKRLPSADWEFLQKSLPSWAYAPGKRSSPRAAGG